MAKPKLKGKGGSRLWRCRKDHVTDNPERFINGSQVQACQTCFYTWLAQEFGFTEVLDPSTLAAYELGGLDAVQEEQALRGPRRVK